jgi:hypothetical protein
MQCSLVKRHAFKEPASSIFYSEDLDSTAQHSTAQHITAQHSTAPETLQTTKQGIINKHGHNGNSLQ